MGFPEQDKKKLIQFLNSLDADIMSNLSTNMAISLYDILYDLSFNEELFDLKISEFFAGMPDKLKVLYNVIGQINLIRTEVIAGTNKVNAEEIEKIITDYFAQRSAQLNEAWKKNN